MLIHVHTKGERLGMRLACCQVNKFVAIEIIRSTMILLWWRVNHDTGYIMLLSKNWSREEGEARKWRLSHGVMHIHMVYIYLDYLKSTLHHSLWLIRPHQHCLKVLLEWFSLSCSLQVNWMQVEGFCQHSAVMQVEGFWCVLCACLIREVFLATYLNSVLFCSIFHGWVQRN